MKAVLGVQKVFVALQVQKDLQFQFSLLRNRVNEFFLNPKNAMLTDAV